MAGGSASSSWSPGCSASASMNWCSAKPPSVTAASPGSTTASLAGMVIASGLAITAIQARDAARDQRREAEGLVAYMVGDLKDKLEPIGKLDALDGVGAKVLDYYSKQDTSALGDAGLMQRSKALSLTAQVAYPAAIMTVPSDCIVKRWLEPPRRSAAIAAIRSGCLTMRRTSSGKASWRGGGAIPGAPRRRIASTSD